MAEGLLGGTPEQEDEGAAVEASEALAGAEAFAAAVAARLSASDPEVARDTSAFLKEQTQLLRVQKEHLNDERALRLAHLRNLLREENVRRFGLRLRVGIQLFLVLVATVIGIGAALMIRDAITSRGVVIEAFSVPPEQAQQGLTGQVVAMQVLDHLAEMQANAWTARPANSYRNNWSGDLKVEIPTTGISFAELSRYLRESLGHETRISGEVYRSPAGVTVTARTGDEPGKSFTGREEDLAALVRRAAESVYEETQPYRYAVFILRENRDAGQAVLERLKADPDPREQAWAHVLSAALNPRDVARGAAEQRAALALMPTLIQAQGNLATTEYLLGHDAASADVANACISAGSAGQAQISRDWRRTVLASCQVSRSLVQGDYAEIVRIGSIASPDKVYAVLEPEWLFVGQLLTHDLDAALATTAAISPNPRLGKKPDQRAGNEALVALERNPSSAVALWTALRDKDDDPAQSGVHDAMLRWDAPNLALSKARSGDLPGARALVELTPHDCYRCNRARGEIAALAGDRADSERWFADAIKQAPTLPLAYVDRGHERLDRGDLVGASADATEAAKLSPHDGDAWKLWGDVLAKQGTRKEALVKYDEALKYAPNWAALKEAREAAAKQKS